MIKEQYKSISIANYRHRYWLHRGKKVHVFKIGKYYILWIYSNVVCLDKL